MAKEKQAGKQGKKAGKTAGKNRKRAVKRRKIEPTGAGQGKQYKEERIFMDKWVEFANEDSKSGAGGTCLRKE